MSKQWGGIHYDSSIFTPEIEAKYPFIKWVEVPSGCLWQPLSVMPTYVPHPIAVLGWSKNTEDAEKLTASIPEQYRNQLYIATIKDGNLFLIKKGITVAGRRTRRNKLRKTRRKNKQ
jgi:hypothetical protein